MAPQPAGWDTHQYGLEFLVLWTPTKTLERLGAAFGSALGRAAWPRDVLSQGGVRLCILHPSGETRAVLLPVLSGGHDVVLPMGVRGEILLVLSGGLTVTE